MEQDSERTSIREHSGVFWQQSSSLLHFKGLLLVLLTALLRKCVVGALIPHKPLLGDSDISPNQVLVHQFRFSSKASARSNKLREILTWICCILEIWTAFRSVSSEQPNKIKNKIQTWEHSLFQPLWQHSRMLSVFSCTMSVFSRLSASTKAPCSTVSSSVVAALSCSAELSSFHAAWACGCSRLLTVATMACRVHSKGSARLEEDGWHQRLDTVLGPPGTTPWVWNRWYQMGMEMKWQMCFVFS